MNDVEEARGLVNNGHNEVISQRGRKRLEERHIKGRFETRKWENTFNASS